MSNVSHKVTLSQCQIFNINLILKPMHLIQKKKIVCHFNVLRLVIFDNQPA